MYEKQSALNAIGTVFVSILAAIGIFTVVIVGGFALAMYLDNNRSSDNQSDESPDFMEASSDTDSDANALYDTGEELDTDNAAATGSPDYTNGLTPQVITQLDAFIERFSDTERLYGATFLNIGDSSAFVLADEGEWISIYESPLSYTEDGTVSAKIRIAIDRNGYITTAAVVNTGTPDAIAISNLSESTYLDLCNARGLLVYAFEPDCPMVSWNEIIGSSIIAYSLSGGSNLSSYGDHTFITNINDGSEESIFGVTKGGFEPLLTPIETTPDNANAMQGSETEQPEISNQYEQNSTVSRDNPPSEAIITAYFEAQFPNAVSIYVLDRTCISAFVISHDNILNDVYGRFVSVIDSRYNIYMFFVTDNWQTYLQSDGFFRLVG